MFMKTKQNTDIHKEDDVCMLAPFYMLQFASFSSRCTDLFKKKKLHKSCQCVWKQFFGILKNWGRLPFDCTVNQIYDSYDMQQI